MLNDSAALTRRITVLPSVAVGWMLGVVAVILYAATQQAGAFSHLAVLLIILVMLLGGSVWMLAGAIVAVRTSSRAQQALLDEVERRGRELLAKPQPSRDSAAPARLVRTRPVTRRTAVVLGRKPQPAGRWAVLTVLPANERPRRVATLLPTDIAPSRHEVLAVAVHPVSAESCVVDARVSRATIQAMAGDPRWSSEQLPTELSIAGGLGGIIGRALAVAVIAAVVSAALGIAVVLLVLP